MPHNRLIPGLAIVAVLAAAVVIPRLGPPTFHGTDLGPNTEVRDFTLTAADRGPVRLSDFRGRAVLLFFGYTSCPDVCPLTMSRLRQVMELLGDRRRDVRVLLVTVDPSVDDPRRLREYVQGFDLGFTGLGGDPATLADVARSFGAWAGEPAAPASSDGHAGHTATDRADSTQTTGARMIPHTPHVFGLDREGRLRVLWNPDMSAEQIAEDVRGLLRI